MAEKGAKSKPRTARAAAKPSPKAQAKAEPKPAPAAAHTAASSTAGVSAEAAFSMLTGPQREALETLSVNLARAALTAQGAIAEAALKQADRPAALSPDPFHVAPALTDVLGQLTARPERLMR
ncbi:MAG TPA: class I poly(R)-hydroxyalkanoic acid synthase, partial [Caulobacteraceae bacterium]|nr:class I poly(R)-hydroxyalkanoic acid synthase [Caulobacteraceae bacterium]